MEVSNEIVGGCMSVFTLWLILLILIMIIRKKILMKRNVNQFFEMSDFDDDNEHVIFDKNFKHVTFSATNV